MKLKLPPVIVFGVFAGLMFLMAKLLPYGDFEFFGRSYLMFGLFGLAFFTGALAVLQFVQSKTSIDPKVPVKATKLVVNGLYKVTRNPMYLALLLILLAWGIWLGNAFSVLLAAGFVSYMNRFQIIPEEEALSQLFGKEYRDYCKMVRRWF
ncbi:isoprenylcysteine carboxylmethyltransferase family protein [bacterium]|nr:isoprenylcysteine carboxylmethyltransferase family protein [bacterium]